MIGLGRRGQGNFLPALMCLRDDFAVAWAHSRTHESLRDVSSVWQVEPADRLDDVTLARVDAVGGVGADRSEHRGAEEARGRMPSRLTVIIDTPVTQSVRDALACARLLAKFKSVTRHRGLHELPEFELARRAVARRR